MKNKILYTKKEIDERVQALADDISRDYKGKDLVIIGILKGAFVFLADVIRYLRVPCVIDFVRLASYGSETVSSGEIKITKDIEIPIQGKDVLVIDDIVDTGLTLLYLVNALKEKKPNSLQVCVFLDKKERRKVHFDPDYIGFEIEDRFIVGYGLDFDEKFRYLPDLYVIDDVDKMDK